MSDEAVENFGVVHLEWKDFVELACAVWFRLQLSLMKKVDIVALW